MSELVECPYCQAVTTVDESDFNKRLLCPSCSRPYAVGDVPSEPSIPKIREPWEAKGQRIVEKVLASMKSAAAAIQESSLQAMKASLEREQERASEAARVAATPEAKEHAAVMPYNVATVILFLAAACFWMGASANVAEGLAYAIGAGTCVICAFLCRVVIAVKLIRYGR